MAVDPAPFQMVDPGSTQTQSAYSLGLFTQYPPSSGPIRTEQDNHFVHVWNIYPGIWNPRAFGRVLVEEASSIISRDVPSGINVRDITDVKRINPTSLIITFKFSNDAARFLSAFSFPGCSNHFQRLRAEFVGDPRPNDRPTMDNICGPPVPGSSSAAPPSRYDNYACP
ncbi:hypothetical protein ARMGADRAFT_1015790 [Armillaria gallica]|uniref:Uncharacterized protein n=1 Tax=Armillaria gallica TaxID=47427 RepID=A0A2H3DMJ1_ARMGA|nr:hypothetical protein ARMGADRAFT_1015790 [Armillaria gallica]